MPILAVYAIPHRDCGSFAAGGFSTADAYRQWIDGVAASLCRLRVPLTHSTHKLIRGGCMTRR